MGDQPPFTPAAFADAQEYEALCERAASPIPVSSAAGGGQATNGPGLLTGWSFRETSGAGVATIRIFDGGGAGGLLVATIQLASTASDHEAFGDSGPLCRGGISVVSVAGTWEGTIYAKLKG